MPDSARPRNPSPAATGIASASRPMRIASVMPSMSAAPLARGAVLQVADLVLDLFFGRTRRDQPRHGSPISSRSKSQRRDEQDQPDHDERREPRDPDRLRDDRRRFQRRLAARSGGPGLGHDAEAMPGDQREAR